MRTAGGGVVKVPKRLRGQSPAHNYAPRQEAEAARIIGGRTVRGSGSGNEKGDARRPRLVRVECKSTSKASFRVTHGLMDEIEAATFGSGEIPLIQIDMLKGNGKLDRRLYVVPDWAMEDLLDRLCSSGG